MPVELFQILKDDAGESAAFNMPANLKTQQWPQDWKKSVFIPIPKKGNAKKCSNAKKYAQCQKCSNAQKKKKMPKKAMFKLLHNCTHLTR